MYIIDYGLGITDKVNGTIDDAFNIAQKNMSYSQRNVYITNTYDQTESYVSCWIGCSPNKNDDILVAFGDFGFYEKWMEYVDTYRR